MLDIIINERTNQIILKLINSDEPIKILDLSELFNVSSRTIRYDLDNIDELLKFNNLPQLVRKPNVGVEIIITPEEKNKILGCIGLLDDYNYILSHDERVNLILSELLQQRSYISMISIADKLLISRSTIIKDFNSVRKWLEDRKLTLLTLPKHGVKIAGEEKLIRKASIELITNTIDINEALDIIKAPLYSKGNIRKGSKIKNLFNDIDMNYVEESVQVAEKVLKTVFSDDAYTSLIIHIAIAIKRIQLGMDIIMQPEDLKALEITCEFSVAIDIAQRIGAHFNVKIPRDEIGYITIHLLGSSISQIKLENKGNWIELQIVTNKIIKSVSNEINLDLTVDRQLFNGLVEHLRPLIYRLKNDIDLKNPLINEIKYDYHELFYIVRAGLTPIEAYIDKTISDDEAAYLTIHFEAAVERVKHIEILESNILIVCGTGMGTAKLLNARIKSLFDVNVVDTVAYHQIHNVLKDKQIDLIISTIPLNIEGIQCIKVNPLLPQEDIELLKRVIKIPRNVNKVFDNLLRVIEKHCDILNHNGLSEDLSKLFNRTEGQNAKGRTEPMLKDILKENTIELNVNAENWQDAVIKGGQLLEKAGAIEHRYIDAMIETVKEFGAYIVISPGIAMPHARPESGAKNIGMSMITLKTPVNFGHPENDPVRVVICLCAVDHSSHIKALSEMADLMGNKEFINILLNAEDKAEILKYIEG